MTQATTTVRTRRWQWLTLAWASLQVFGTPAVADSSMQDDANPAVQSYLRQVQKWRDPELDSLSDLSMDALRDRPYRTEVEPLEALHEGPRAAAYKAEFMGDGHVYGSWLFAYDSDGLRVYGRLDLPDGAAPEGGYPVVVFMHGWYGREAAPGFDFMYEPGSQYARVIDHFADAGFAVLTPAWRGHGTVGGVPSEGMQFLDAFDNGSYLSPVFYAIDALNLVAGLDQIEAAAWKGREALPALRLDRARVGIVGHSQGGDVALIALGVSGEGSRAGNLLTAGSIWSGCIASRFEQARTYEPMAKALEAFLAGDSQWTGTATGRDGRINPNFIFGYPPDWIVTTDIHSAAWTWQAETWSAPGVAVAWSSQLDEMYATVNSRVADIDKARFDMLSDASGRSFVRHDRRVELAMANIGAFDQDRYLTEPLNLHFSDQDYYSPPEWNRDLAQRIRGAGGQAHDFLYPHNTHSLGVSPHEWFSPPGTEAGFPLMLRRDLGLFRGDAPATWADANDPLSVEALRRLASAPATVFEPAIQMEPLEGMPRRVVQFQADGLRQYALVIEPAGPAPDGGWPVLLMNHGYHPNPPDYARIADGSTDRPGDYYRALPPAFARLGFLVVVPDYRGHNDSGGSEYAASASAAYWYARDVVTAGRAIPSLPNADPGRIYLWGHSMGGHVTLRAALALGDLVRAASIWSSGGRGENDPAEPGPYLPALAVPLNLHHAVADDVTPIRGSEAIAGALAAAGRPHRFYRYDSADHLFEGDDLAAAIRRDFCLFGDATTDAPRRVPDCP
jgi:dienelactone hydrolase